MHVSVKYFYPVIIEKERNLLRYSAEFVCYSQSHLENLKS